MFVCSNCGRNIKLREENFPFSCGCGAYYANMESSPKVSLVTKSSSVPKPVPLYTTGTRLRELFDSLGIKKKFGCSCDYLIFLMNVWGPYGCREKMVKIVDELEANKVLYSWREQNAAKLKAIATGLAFKINWLDPFPGIVEEAIRLSESDLSPPAEAG